jgi:flagellar hook-associated protein 3 FlgL
MSSGMRAQVLRIQSELSKAQDESASGQVTDVGLALGLSSGRTLSFDYQQTSFQTIVDSNKVISGRLDATNQALTQLMSIAQDFTTQLTSARGSNADPQIIVNKAKASLQSMLGALSTTFAGEYVFSGIKSDVQPVADYPGSPPSAGKTAVDAAFHAAFGMAQTDPTVSTISGTDVTNFLATTYSGLFDSSATGWSANFFNGSSTAMTARITQSESMTASVTGNEAGFRDIMSALTMVADLGAEHMTKDAFTAVLDGALKASGKAQTELTALQTRVGLMQSRTTTASENLTAQKDLLAKTFSGATSVDPYEAATRVNQLTTQLQTAYSLTSRLQQLSLLKYL